MIIVAKIAVIDNRSVDISDNSFDGIGADSSYENSDGASDSSSMNICDNRSDKLGVWLFLTI